MIQRRTVEQRKNRKGGIVDHNGKASPGSVPINTPLWLQWIAYLIKDVGMPVVMSVGLVIVVVYMLLVQMPTMQQDFREQTNKLVDAVGNNNKVMGELSYEIRQLRQERWQPWWKPAEKKP